MHHNMMKILKYNIYDMCLGTVATVVLPVQPKGEVALWYSFIQKVSGVPGKMKVSWTKRKENNISNNRKKSIGSTSSSSFAITFLIISWPLRFVLWPLEGVSRPPGWEPHAFMNTNMGKYGTYGAHVVLRLWLVAQPQSKHRFKVKGVGLGGLVELTTKLNIDFLPLHF